MPEPALAAGREPWRARGVIYFAMKDTRFVGRNHSAAAAPSPRSLPARLPRGRVRVSASRPTPEPGSLRLPRRLELSCGKGWEMSVTLSEKPQRTSSRCRQRRRTPSPPSPGLAAAWCLLAPLEPALQPIPSASSLLLGGIRDTQAPMPGKARWSREAAGPAPGMRLGVTSASSAWAGARGSPTP